MITQHEDNAEQIRGEYRWRKFAGPEWPTQITDGTLQECAAALGLDENDVAWAIEEYGRCDVGTIVAWKPGEPQYDDREGMEGEPTGGGFEWPATEAPAIEE